MGQGNISREDRDANALKIASIWLGREDVWLKSTEIKAEFKEDKHRTVSRYLQRLVKAQKLEFRNEGMRVGQPKSGERFYRPSREYWQKTFKWIPVNRKADDVEYLFFTDLASKINDKFETAESGAAIVAVKSELGDARGLSRDQLNELNALISKFVRTARSDLSREYFGKNKEPEEVYELLRDSTQRIIIAYLDLWAFLNSNYGSREIFSKQMVDVQRTVAKLKRKNP